MSKDVAPRAQSFLELIYGAKRRLPSIFGVPCSSFDIPAEGGSFSRRSPGKSLGYLIVKLCHFPAGYFPTVLKSI